MRHVLANLGGWRPFPSGRRLVEDAAILAATPLSGIRKAKPQQES